MSAELPQFRSDRHAFGKGLRLANVVRVQYDTMFRKHDADARELFLTPGDRVVVDTTLGPVVATVKSWAQRVVISEDDLQPVLRKVTPQDEAQVVRNADNELEGYRFAIERIRARKLEMKLVRVQWTVDGSKALFYFSADGRVDFRDLVKDLAHRFRTRIEMRQIGARDGTGMVGGIGPCGRELCCSTFLENFAPVSIRMAKDQGLTLNPTKVSGMCGRLMCCLVYEQQIYRSMKKRLPRAKTQVVTRQGPGKVIDIDVINQKLTVEYADGMRSTLDVGDVRVGGAKGQDDGYVDTAHSAPEYVWEEVFAEPRRAAKKTAKGGEQPAKKKSRRRRRRRRGGKKKPDQGS